MCLYLDSFKYRVHAFLLFQRCQADDALLLCFTEVSAHLSARDARIRAWMTSDVFGACVVDAASRLCGVVRDGSSVESGASDALMQTLCVALTDLESGLSLTIKSH